jgi:gliding motility-associated lipoprotein GldD
MNKRLFLIVLSFLLVFSSCEDEVSSPRPFGYFRIDLPEPNYELLEVDCPFSFEYSDQARIILKDPEKCWLNIYYPQNKATIYLTYNNVDQNLKEQLDQTQQLTYEHQIKATRIDRILVQRDSVDVYGLKYRLDGDVASYIQFYLTDSTDHFLRGALYFESYVNADSLRPVVEYMDRDIQHLISTFQWK